MGYQPTRNCLTLTVGRAGPTGRRISIKPQAIREGYHELIAASSLYETYTS